MYWATFLPSTAALVCFELNIKVNVPKFLKLVIGTCQKGHCKTNSANPNQNASEEAVLSGSSLFAVPTNITMCQQEAKALARLNICAGSSEPSLLRDFLCTS